MKTIKDVIELLGSNGVLEMRVKEPLYKVKLVCMEPMSYCNEVIVCNELIQNFEESFIKVVVGVYFDLGIGSPLETAIVLNVKEVVSIEDDGIVVRFHEGFDKLLFEHMNQIDKASGLATRENPGKFCEVYKIVIEKNNNIFTNVFTK